MTGSVISPLVCFHNVELGAEISANSLRITVVKAVRRFKRLTICADSWHSDHVEGSDAATVNSAEINIVFHGATEEIGLEVGIRTPVLRRREICSSIEAHFVACASQWGDF